MFYLVVSGKYLASKGELVEMKRAALAARTYSEIKEYQQQVKQVYKIDCKIVRR